MTLISAPETAPARQTPDRALATLDTVLSVRAIPDADAIECVRVRGWDVVTRKGEFAPGDTVLYIEVDSFLDITDERFAFLAPRGVREDETTGRQGHVLKTARMRGQYSQGIVFSPDEFPELSGATVGDDVTALLGIIKWEPPIPADLLDKLRGGLLSWVHETREERVQNLGGIPDTDDGWVATEKIDGNSMSVWVDGDDEGVSGRNWDLIRNDDNHMWATALKLGLHERLRAAFPGARAVLQGEFYGPGVQKNPLRVEKTSFAAFTLSVEGVELPRSQWPDFAAEISVPVHNLTFPATADEALEQVNGLKSLVNPARAAEGVVWRNRLNATMLSSNGQIVRASFKVVANSYLLKHDR